MFVSQIFFTFLLGYMVEFISENTFVLPMGGEGFSLRVTGMHEQTMFDEEELFMWCRYRDKIH